MLYFSLHPTCCCGSAACRRPAVAHAAFTSLDNVPRGQIMTFTGKLLTSTEFRFVSYSFAYRLV
jgi:hypothetical protein